MSSFDVLDFVSSPDLDKLVNVPIAKDQWKFIAMYFKIPFFTSDTKEQIKCTVINDLVSRKLLPPTVRDLDFQTTEPGLSQGEVSDGESEKMYEARTKCENPRRQSVDFGRLNMERIIAQEKATAQEKLMHLEMMKIKEQAELEQVRLAAERQTKREEIELHQLKLEIEREKAQAEDRKMKYEVELAQLNRDNPRILRSGADTLDISKYSQLVASFDEKDPEAFFSQFEKLATNLEWDKKFWPVLVQTKFVGRARQVFVGLDGQDSMNYDIVKTTVLTAYDQVTEKYRQQFRNYQKTNYMTYVEYAEDSQRFLNKWLHSRQVTTFESLKELLLMEQFMLKSSPEIRVYLEERECTNVKAAAKLADNYVLTHRRFDVPPVRARNFVKEGSETRSPSDSVNGYKSSDKTDDHNPKFKYFERKTYPPAQGAAQSVIVKRALPGIENNFTGEQVILQDLTGNPSLPLANIHLHSGLVFGDVVVGVRDDPLPVKDVQFLLGNDLAGSLVIPQPIVCPIPADVDPVLTTVEEDESLFPDCVVTRSQVRQREGSTTPSSDASNMESRDSFLTDIRDLFNSENTETYENVPVTRVALTEAQQNDKTLTSIRCRTVEKLELCKGLMSLA
ncbi:hypothetical protein Pmani_009471 [Petrolisthes manimaculis]|uniref:SCAN box domain-containing protein n=1 Tax=Petrolisthes manimaculis TaxID=1843537 RepID=A0AAE1Q4V9_9EUCA|nr:hypothetical protein Pmani_009471 [Petrolisthes manimaculis]